MKKKIPQKNMIYEAVESWLRLTEHKSIEIYIDEWKRPKPPSPLEEIIKKKRAKV